jgi:uncharacterized CHY-type Zn-finger protein
MSTDLPILCIDCGTQTGMVSIEDNASPARCAQCLSAYVARCEVDQDAYLAALPAGQAPSDGVDP